MNSHTAFLLFASLSILIVDVHGQTNFVITSFGAVADGKTDSKLALANAWKKACQTPGGVLTVPAGKTFMVSGGDFFGPCNGDTTFQIDGTLVASDDPKLDSLEYWLAFDSVDRLKLVGKGVFDGHGSSSWSRCGASSNCRSRPYSLRFHDVEGALIRGITSLNSKMFHIHIHKCNNLRFEGVSLKAPASSPNTDGIHIGNSMNVQIVDSLIATGDDCVSLGDGSRAVEISGVKCGPGHGISIGSLGKNEDEDDVRDITVKNCTLTNTDNGLRIKTWAPSKSSPVVSNVTYSDITLQNVENPIIIDQNYCPHGECEKTGESGVRIVGVKYINVRGSSATKTGVDVQCSGKMPCEDVSFTDINLTSNRLPTIASCSNFDGRFQRSTPSRCS